jgi:alkylated DNA repair dioxygenase AlkB
LALVGHKSTAVGEKEVILPDLSDRDNQSRTAGTCQHFVLPDAELWLWPNWLDPQRSAVVLETLKAQLQWQQPELKLFGKSVSIPRQQVWMGDSHCRYRYSGVTFSPEPWHPLVQKLTAWVNQQLNRSFNCVLLNLYQDGGDHMGWHSDDEPELGPNPDVASLSLGQARRFDLKHKNQQYQLSLPLQDGDLLLMQWPCQHFWLHRVPKQSQANSARLNLTFRYIEKPL